MEYKVYEPCAALAKQIKTYWSLDSGHDGMPHSRERIFPDGCIELIFNHGDRFKKYDSETEYHLQPLSFIHGQLKTYFELEATGTVGIFSARFHPAGLQPFINFAVDAFTGSTLTVTEVWGDEGTALETAILNCTAYDENNHSPGAVPAQQAPGP